MTAIRLQIGIFVTFRVKIGAQVIVILDEEIGAATTNPEKFGVLAEQVVDLRITVSIDIGEAVGIGLLLIHSGREQSYVTKHLRIVDADEEAMETTHRQASNGAMIFILLHAVGLLNEVHHIGEGGLE